MKAVILILSVVFVNFVFVPNIYVKDRVLHIWYSPWRDNINRKVIKIKL